MSRVMDPFQLGALADLFDQKVELDPGAAVPVGWHWVVFTASCPQGSLGEDGHPAAGGFFPPFEDRRRMMAGGRLRQEQSLRVGETYERRSELADAVVKVGRSGTMLFTTVRHTFRTQGGVVVAVEEEDVVYRRQAPGAVRNLVAEGGGDDPWHLAHGASGRLSVTADPRTLFRFSALTYNAHRIHYDRPYVTDVEGYPDLVVHGPLLVLAMLELPRRVGTPPRSVAYRLSKPAFAGDEIVATWDGQLLRAGTASGTAMSASAEIGSA